MIDASVAGKRETHEFRISLGFLNRVRDVCHLVVMTPEITAEWRNHHTRSTQRWLLSMYAKRKVTKLESIGSADLRNGIASAGMSEKDQAAMSKDAHLIEAALDADSIVVSWDQRARQLFVQLSIQVGALQSVNWVTPERALDLIGADQSLQFGKGDALQM